MSITYHAYQFTVKALGELPSSIGVDILIAQLGETGFESFIETDDGVTGYINAEEIHESLLDEVHILSSPDFSIFQTTEAIEQVNWNKEWENNIDPIVVDDICTVRAPFNNIPTTKYDIVIEPKMSFGTGHHATTHMMIQHILKDSWQDKRVLDMGSGTGVLAILAEMKGATSIKAIDIDTWCYENALENIERNNCKNITAIQGDVDLIENDTYNTIIANINRNILLEQIPVYSKTLITRGTLYLSGFYEADLELMNEACLKDGLHYDEHLVKEDWVAVKFSKRNG
ncbi:50S ribosomal protein L11 methyltransferase [Gangjinia marincola]|uniref:Ribosomal protein L11 methyltransferase n=1 Tax=Gangjinia marincola TaxID=578463 RepID=A0ABN1MJM4_9FLAO